MRFTPHEYQVRAIRHIIDNKSAGLFLDMGLGKTVSTLTAVNALMYDRLEVERVLVIAPKRVAEDTWSGECAKWDHLSHLTISKVLGPESRRLEALRAEADIYVINRENVEWLCGIFGKKWPYDMVVIDELSSFKSGQSKRFKALRKVRPYIKRIVGLTGTPCPNGLIDLWSQVYLLDMGQRLGMTIGCYRDRWFRAGRRNGPVIYEWTPRPGAEEEITGRLSDICISMSAEDYLTLPDLMVHDWRIVPSREIRKDYDELQRELVLDLDEKEITATTAATLTGKLQQFTGGALYDTLGDAHEHNTAKLDALADIVEQTDGPVLVFYYFKHELSRILERLKAYAPEVIGGSESIARWNEGRIRVLLAHPASAGHGLNLQRGGNVIIWYTLPWSCELYEQAVARLHRQGQERPVMVYRLVMAGTVDERVIKALAGKQSVQEAVMSAVKELKQQTRIWQRDPLTYSG